VFYPRRGEPLPLPLLGGRVVDLEDPQPRVRIAVREGVQTRAEHHDLPRPGVDGRGHPVFGEPGPSREEQPARPVHRTDARPGLRRRDVLAQLLGAEPEQPRRERIDQDPRPINNLMTSPSHSGRPRRAAGPHPTIHTRKLLPSTTRLEIPVPPARAPPAVLWRVPEQQDLIPAIRPGGRAAKLQSRPPPQLCGIHAEQRPCRIRNAPRKAAHMDVHPGWGTELTVPMEDPVFLVEIWTRDTAEAPAIRGGPAVKPG